MRHGIGEEGTEQFTVTTRVDGEVIAHHAIHDPFVRTTVTHVMSRWDHFKAVFSHPTLRIHVCVEGSEGVNKAIMTLDPIVIANDTENILAARRESRESLGVLGHHDMNASL